MAAVTQVRILVTAFFLAERRRRGRPPAPLSCAHRTANVGVLLVCVRVDKITRVAFCCRVACRADHGGRGSGHRPARATAAAAAAACTRAGCAAGAVLRDRQRRALHGNEHDHGQLWQALAGGAHVGARAHTHTSSLMPPHRCSALCKSRMSCTMWHRIWATRASAPPTRPPSRK